jgi:hypothetical protein
MFRHIPHGSRPHAHVESITVPFRIYASVEETAVSGSYLIFFYIYLGRKQRTSNTPSSVSGTSAELSSDHLTTRRSSTLGLEETLITNTVQQ